MTQKVIIPKVRIRRHHPLSTLFITFMADAMKKTPEETKKLFNIK